MLRKRMKPTEYQVDSWPPSGTYTTSGAECCAHVWNQQNTGLICYRRPEHTSWMLCKRMKLTEYRVDSLPPSRTYTTSSAECFAYVWNQENTELIGYRRPEPTCWIICKRMKLIKHQVNSLPPSGTYTTPGAECFAHVWNQQNTELIGYRRPEPTCWILYKRMKPTEYQVDSLPPSWTYTTSCPECFAHVWN